MSVEKTERTHDEFPQPNFLFKEQPVYKMGRRQYNNSIERTPARVYGLCCYRRAVAILTIVASACGPKATYIDNANKAEQKPPQSKSPTQSETKPTHTHQGKNTAASVPLTRHLEFPELRMTALGALPMGAKTMEGEPTGNVTVTNRGRTICLAGNNLRGLRLAKPYALSASTVLEFEYRSNGGPAKVHAIGLDNQTGAVPAADRGYQILGTQTSSYRDTHQEYKQSGAFQRYQIPVAELRSAGLEHASYVFLVNRTDRGIQDSACFRNIRLREPLPIKAKHLVAHPPQDAKPPDETRPDALSFCVSGKTGSAVSLTPAYQVTPRTVIEFDVASVGQETITGRLGFHTALEETPHAARTVTFDHPVGDPFQRQKVAMGKMIPKSDHRAFPNLFFFGDSKASPNSKLCFKNVEIYEAVSRPIDFSASPILPYAPYPELGDKDGSATTQLGGRAICLRGNSWKALKLLDSYEVTSQTFMEFDFKSDGATAEINGVGLDTQTQKIPPKGRTIQVAGSQALATSLKGHSGYSMSGRYQRFRIPIGQSYASQDIKVFDHIYFVNDGDLGQKTSVCYRDVRLFEQGTPNYPDTIDTLTVNFRTGSHQFAGTDHRHDLRVCLNNNFCRRLSLPQMEAWRNRGDARKGEFDPVKEPVTGFQPGKVGVYHFKNLGLPRSAVDRVEIRSTNGTNALNAACIQLSFDGQPVYCSKTMESIWFGSDQNEHQRWRDPQGLQTTCNSCSDTPISHGPMLGAVDTQVARIWLRTDSTRRVTIRTSKSPDLKHSQAVASSYPSPNDDFTTVLEVPASPDPNQEIYYGIAIDGKLHGPTRSLPRAPRKGGMVNRFAFGSCSRFPEQPIFDAVAAYKPDLFIFGGDNHYADSSNIEALRWFYRRSRDMKEQANVMENTPTLAIWDDHDFLGDNTTGLTPGRNKTLRVFREYWANRTYGGTTAKGVFGVHRWGDVEFFLLDNRYHQGVTPGSMFGPEQRTWLLSALRASKATFKFLVTGVVWSRDHDWDKLGLEADRNAVLEAVAQVPGVVVLSGDIHRTQITQIPKSRSYRVLELTSSGLANFHSTCPAPARQEEIYCTDKDSFIGVEVDTTRPDPELRVHVFDIHGDVLHTNTFRHSEFVP